MALSCPTSQATDCGSTCAQAGHRSSCRSYEREYQNPLDSLPCARRFAENRRTEKTSALLNGADLIDRLLAPVDNKSTDTGTTVWREPAANDTSAERFAAELEVLRGVPMVFA